MGELVRLVPKTAQQHVSPLQRDDQQIGTGLANELHDGLDIVFVYSVWLNSNSSRMAESLDPAFLTIYSMEPSGVDPSVETTE